MPCRPGVLAVDDVLVWSVLAVVVVVSGSGGPDQGRLLLTVPYLLTMLLVLRPALRRWAATLPAGA